MATLYERMQIYNPDLTRENYQSLIDALKEALIVLRRKFPWTEEDE